MSDIVFYNKITVDDIMEYLKDKDKNTLICINNEINAILKADCIDEFTDEDGNKCISIGSTL